MNDVHRQVGDLTQFTPGNVVAAAHLEAEIERQRRYIRILESKLDRETLKECITQRNALSEPE